MTAMRDIFLVIHNVRSVHNVGSLFRTADGMGVSKIYLTGYTPGPVDRFSRTIPAFTKVSLGAEESVPWETREITELITELKQANVELAALEQTPNAASLDTYTPSSSVALIVGNEVDGILEDILATCDVVLEIPMKGKKESLNVSNAGAIALYHLSRFK